MVGRGFPAQGLAAELDVFGVVDESVEDGVGQCWIVELSVPELVTITLPRWWRSSSSSSSTCAGFVLAEMQHDHCGVSRDVGDATNTAEIHKQPGGSRAVGWATTELVFEAAPARHTALPMGKLLQAPSRSAVAGARQERDDGATTTHGAPP